MPDVLTGLKARPAWVALASIYAFCILFPSYPFTSVTRVFEAEENPLVAQAQAWWSGRLDLPQRLWDTALFNERVYAVQPPAYSFLAAAVLPWSPKGVPRWVFVLVLGLSAPALAFALFRRRVVRITTAVVLTIGLVCGTSLAPVLVQSLSNGNVYAVNVAISAICQLIFLGEFFGKRRVWLMGPALAVSTWARQLTVFYFLPCAWAAWHGEGARWRRMIAAAGWSAVAAALPMTLNTLKFGHPLESGYRYLYVERDDPIAQDAAHGIFAPRFIPRNLYYMNLGLPVIRHYPRGDQLEANSECTGVWWTSPILVLLLARARAIWRRPEHRVLLAAAAFAFAALTLYHATGRSQYGHNRYSLDYLPALFAALAPQVEWGRWKWIGAACVMWSAVYFCRLIAV
ncbi:MAG: hypothetical protein IT449_17055 [Phycisphaerales bacterium]|nr:hypothetical protein [Phycisphaerales bacterium]